MDGGERQPRSCSCSHARLTHAVKLCANMVCMSDFAPCITDAWGKICIRILEFS